MEFLVEFELSVPARTPQAEVEARGHAETIAAAQLARLSKVYRLEATLGAPLDLGEVAQGHRRIVPQTGGTFTGPDSTASCSPVPARTGRSSCRMAPRSATSATRCRPTAAICSTSNREACAMAAPRFSHVSGAVRMSTPASTPSAPQPRSRPPPPELDWLNKGVFISVGARQTAGVIYETYLVE
jgi:hypothetical protein